MENSKSDIFMTEYLKSDLEKNIFLPLITKTPKTAVTIKSLRFSNQKNKSAASSSINLSHRRLVSPDSQNFETFESRFQKFRSEVTERAKTNSSSFKNPEFDPKAVLDVQNIEQQVSSKQRFFNKIKHEVEKKSEILAKLKSELGSIRKEDTSSAYSLMEKRKSELKEIRLALYNELYYKETLSFLLNQKKVDLPEQEKAVIGLKEALKQKRKDLASLKNQEDKEKQEIANLKQTIQDLYEEIRSVKEEHNSTYKKQIELFSQKAKLKETLEQEHELNTKSHQQRSIESKIKEIKIDLLGAEKSETNWAENQKKADQKNFMDEEYLKVKNLGVTNKPQQLNFEYEELKVKNFNLENDRRQAIDKINALTIEWQKLNKELNEITLNHEADRKINRKEFEKIENSLKEKDKQMNENESILKNLDFIISSVFGSVSRIGVLLDEEKSSVKPHQLQKDFEFYVVGIEKKLDFIVQQKLSEEKLKELASKFPGFVSVYCKNRGQYESANIW